MDVKLRRRRHNANLLLLQNLLMCQPGTSPFTLVQDSISQPAKPLLAYYIQHATSSKTPIIFVSFETYPPPINTYSFVKGRRKDPKTVREEIVTALRQCQSQKILVIIDTLHPLCAVDPPFSLATYLLSLLALSPNMNLVAVYHTDVPLPVPNPSPSNLLPSLTPSMSSLSHNPDSTNGRPITKGNTVKPQNAYAPAPLVLLTFLSTTILTTSSLAQTLAKKIARDRSLAEPVFGIEEEKEGILTALHSQATTSDGSTKGFVLEMEHRRKSGRTGAVARFYMPPPAPDPSDPKEGRKPIMLEDHPLFRPKQGEREMVEEGEKGTFELELTEKQKRAREGIMLPYYDAQKADGTGNKGGRILYDMGIEDDFDEEEDEI